MKKVIFISFYTVFSVLPGCGVKSDYSFQKEDTLIQKSNNGTVRNDLSEIEDADKNFNYSQVIEKYKNNLTSEVSITRFRNFVVFSTLTPGITYNIIDNDIRLTIDGMLNTYVKIKPDKVTPIFLFQDYESYKDFSLSTFDFDEKDLSPYGYFKISKNVIAIRYVSWKGSIAHEVTHAMIQNDFPDIPSWLNEGMAALHEKSTYKNGVLVGDFSWRILSTRRAMSDNTYTNIENLMTTNDEELYGKRSSFYYAQSRYLLMMLQRQGLLKDFYLNFRDTYENDKTGITQLEKITGKELADIDKELVEFLNSFKDQTR